MRKTKEVAAVLQRVNGLFVKYKKANTDENEALLKESLTELRELITEMKLD